MITTSARTSCARGALFLCLLWALAAAAGEFRLLPGDNAIGAAIGMQTAPVVAEGVTAEGITVSLVVWQDLRSSPFTPPPFASDGRGFDIYALRVDADGMPIDPAPTLIARHFGDQGAPQVAWNGQDWLVAWSGPNSTAFNQRIEAVRIASDGSVLDGSPFIVQNSMSSARFALVANGSEWLVVAHASSAGENNFRATRISAAGAVLDPGGAELIPATNSLYSFQLASAQGEYLLVWGNSATAARAQRFTGELSPIGVPFPVGSLNIVSNGSEYLVAGEAKDANFDKVVLAQRFSVDGVPGPLLTLAGTGGGLGTVVPPQLDLGWDGTDWWVSWLEVTRNVVFSRVTANDTVLDFGGLEVDPVAPGRSAFVHSVAGLPGGGAQFAWADGRAAGYPNLDVLGASLATAGASETLATSASAQLGADFASGRDAAGNDQLLAVFASELSGDRRIFAQRLDGAGNALDAEPFELARGSALGFPHVGFDGTRYMVVWSDNGQVQARRVAPDGSVIDAAPLAIMDGSSPDVDGQDGRFLVVATRAVTTIEFFFPFSMRVDGASGANLDAAPVILGQYFARNPRVIALNGRWLATWQRNPTHDNPDSSVHAIYIEANGTPFVFDPLRSADFVIGFGGATPSLATSGEQVLFVWRELSPNNSHNDVLGFLIPAGTTPDFDLYPSGAAPGFSQQPFEISAAPSPNREFDPDVTWNGSEFVVAWTDMRSSVIYFDKRTEVFAARVLPDGQLLDPGGFAFGDRAEQEMLAAVAGVGGRTLIAASSFRDEPGLQSYRLAYQMYGDSPLGNRWPVALVAASNERGDVPLATAFSGSASFDPDGGAVAFAWDFGDGSSAIGADVVHDYQVPGEYLAQLTVADAQGASTTSTVRVVATAPNIAPVAVASASPTSGPAPLRVVFDASKSYDLDDGIKQIAWDFGDGSTSFGSTAFHTYSSAGSFTATLTVSDQHGAVALDSVTVDVAPPNQPPLAVAAATPSSGISPLSVRFSPTGSSDPDGAITAYRWDFGDGSSATEMAPVHVYQTGGQFQAMLTVTDNEGASGTATVLVDVTQGDLTSVAVADFATDAGTISAGSYLDTADADGVFEALSEEQSNGNRTKRRSQLSHTWRFDVAPGLNYSFHVEAYHTANAEGDDFAFEYSRDGANFAPLLVVTATSPGAAIQSQAFTEDVGGTLYVRVTDTDRSAGSSAIDTLFVDRMFVVTSFQGDGTPPAPPAGLTATGGDGVVSLAWIGNSEADLAGYQIYRATAAGGPYGPLASVPAPANGFDDLSVSNGVTYYYVLSALDTSGNESATGDEASATPQAGGATRSVHVSSLVLETAPGARGSKFAQATVTVIDEQGNRVEAALVTGSFSGGVTETVDAVTGADGIAVLTSSASAKGLSFTFCVDDVSGVGLIYAPPQNGTPLCASF